MLKLWYHECCRVFEDRLVNNEDRNWFQSLLKNNISKFDVDSKAVFEHEILLYGDFGVPNAEPKLYEEINDIPKVFVDTSLCQ